MAKPVSDDVKRAKAPLLANSYPPKCRAIAAAMYMHDWARGDGAMMLFFSCGLLVESPFRLSSADEVLENSADVAVARMTDFLAGKADNIDDPDEVTLEMRFIC